MAAAISSGAMFRRSGTSRRKNSAGKKRSSVPSTNFVGTFGQASSGHGDAIEASDGCARSLLSASSASCRGTSW